MDILDYIFERKNHLRGYIAEAERRGLHTKRNTQERRGRLDELTRLEKAIRSSGELAVRLPEADTDTLRIAEKFAPKN